jgi:Fumarylacetoacetate (FAA) hydrolase family
VVCLGLNYRSHLAEIGEPASQYPILFHKAATSLIGHEQAIVLPRISRQVDDEGELAVVIGRRGKHIPEQDALSYVLGYTCANDVSAHDLEFRTSQWTSGKMLDTFCPLGPVLVTRDEIPDPGVLFTAWQTARLAPLARMILACPSPMNRWSSPLVYCGLSGRKTARSAADARNAITNSGQLGRTAATESPCPTPSERSPAAHRWTRLASSS